VNCFRHWPLVPCCFHRFGSTYGGFIPSPPSESSKKPHFSCVLFIHIQNELLLDWTYGDDRSTPPRPHPQTKQKQICEMREKIKMDIEYKKTSSTDLQQTGPLSRGPVICLLLVLERTAKTIQRKCHVLRICRFHLAKIVIICSLFYDAFSVTRLYSVYNRVTSEWRRWIDENKHQCLTRDSNPRSQRPSNRCLPSDRAAIETDM
jgi:hypothetical protein